MAEDPTELNEQVSLIARLSGKISTEAIAIGLSASALMLSCLSLLLAGMSVFFVLQSSAAINQQNVYLDDLSENVATYRFQQALTHSELKAHGFELIPLENP